MTGLETLRLLERNRELLEALAKGGRGPGDRLYDAALLERLNLLASCRPKAPRPKRPKGVAG